MTQARDKRKEAGFTTIEWIFAVGLSLLLMVMLVNYIAIQYGRATLRNAVDEGSRAGARVSAANYDPAATCKQREHDALDGMGTMAEIKRVDCNIDPADGRVHATVTATFKGWLPIMPDIEATATATSVSEDAKAPK